MLESVQNRARATVHEELTAAAFSALFSYMDLRLRFDPSYRRLFGQPEPKNRWWKKKKVQNGDAQLKIDGKSLRFRSSQDWRSRLLIATRDGRFACHATVENGRVRHGRGMIEDADAALWFADARSARRMLTESPAKVLEMLLDGDLVSKGNLSDLSRLSFVLSYLGERFPMKRQKPQEKQRGAAQLKEPRRSLPMSRCDVVKYLDDPGLSAYTLHQFPRLKRFKETFFNTTPEICIERPHLYTEATKRLGFENGLPPAMRQAEVFHHLMRHRQPIIREGDLLAGTTTSKPIGVVVYPECGGIPIWPELETMSRRELNPYTIGSEEVRILSEEVFPYWMDRNVREFARKRYDNPRWLELDERWVLYFQWKTQAVSHTIADFPTVLSRGLEAIITEATRRADQEGSTFHRAMARALSGVLAYAHNLARQAETSARSESDPERKEELLEIARICRKVPRGPAETLHEAIQSIWIVWVGCHMESTNAGLSIGRVDQWLQPYFEADMAHLISAAERETYIERAIELVGCFYLRCTDHLPQVADLGNKLFGGSSSDQVITLGGVTPSGKNGVSDMTYICLKVTEMLGLRDPNVNARYYEGINSVDYLKRLCEVNYLTGATPSIHNDEQLIDVLVDQGMKPAHARDWSATGCVEPTSCGRHYGHTNCMMFNLVAPLEMALFNGFHPLLKEQVGPQTGDPRSFTSYEQFKEAYYAQLRWQIEIATTGNNQLGECHQYVRPTPYLSALIDGPMEKGRDLIEGGARYNSSGIGNVGLTDVIDSLMAIKKLVFEERSLSMADLIDTLENDFDGQEKLLAQITHRIPKFGSGDEEVHHIALEVARFVHETFRAQPHYRSGHYNSGFWSMSNHVAFGLLSGALPSGRRKGQPFTPGLTPAASRGSALPQQIHDVAALDHHVMPNNIAFNIKVAPAPGDSQADSLDQMTAYARTYVQQGGMQLQFNVVSSETLEDARAHPEKYPDLMVRISGYNAYFNDLNDDIKRELIDRAEHILGAT